MFGTILFDLDGTLTFPYIGITNGVMYALRRLGENCPEREELKCFIGPPLLDEFREKFGFSDEKAKKAVLLYREYYSETGIFENELMKDAKKTLDALKEKDKRICLATCKPREFSVRILERFGVLEYFDFIGAATFGGEISTKEDVVRLVLEKTGAMPADCLMVGDRRYDIEGAHAAGVKCAGVLCGFGDREELSLYNADFIVPGLFDILSLV